MTLGVPPLLGFVPPPAPLLPPLPVFAPPAPAAPPGAAPLQLPEFLRPFEFPPPAESFQESGIPRLPGPGDFPREAIQPGPEIVPFVPPPFTGGQCDTVVYFGTIEYDTGTGLQEQFFKARGPIGGFVSGSNSSGFPGYGLVSRGDQIRNGTPYNCGGLAPTLRPSGYRQYVNGENFEGVKVTVDGQCSPGDCGDPPPLQEEVRVPNPARAFAPSPPFVPAPAPVLPPAPLPLLPVPLPVFPPFVPAPGVEPDRPRLPVAPEPGISPGIAPAPAPLLPTVIPSLPVLFPGAPTRQPEPPRAPVGFISPIPPPVNLDCCALPAIERLQDEIRREFEDARSRSECEDLCEPAVMLTKECQELAPGALITQHSAVTVLDLSSGLGRLSRQIAEIAEYLNICGQPRLQLNPCPPPGDVGQPVGTFATGRSGQAFGQVPSGQVLTGMRIRLEEVPAAPNQYEQGVFRGVGYFYMGTSEGLDQDFAGSMIKDGQFIFAEQCNLTHWLVTANTGYNILVTPFSRTYQV